MRQCYEDWIERRGLKCLTSTENTRKKIAQTNLLMENTGYKRICRPKRTWTEKMTQVMEKNSLTIEAQDRFEKLVQKDIECQILPCVYVLIAEIVTVLHTAVRVLSPAGSIGSNQES